MAMVDWLRAAFPDLEDLTPLSQGGQSLYHGSPQDGWRRRLEGDQAEPGSRDRQA